MCLSLFHVFFFNDPATTEIYTLSLHDALPISRRGDAKPGGDLVEMDLAAGDGLACLARERSIGHAERVADEAIDRKSTRLNSSHPSISYAVFCLKKKKKKKKKQNKKE